MSVVAQAQVANSLAEDAAAFGSRESVAAPALSPNGREILYLTPGPGRSTIAVATDLGTGKTRMITKAEGGSDRVHWCKYVSEQRIVCRISGLVDNRGTMATIARLVALDVDGGNMKMIGQSSSAYDAQLRQFDGEVIDWMDGRDGAILMSRMYIPEEHKTNTRLVRTKSGLGVDRVDTANLSTVPVEPPRDGASAYLGDDRGNVRLMELSSYDAQGYLNDQVSYLYRTASSRDWRPLATSLSGDFAPLAIDSSSNRLYALRKRDGRYVLTAMTLSDAPSEAMIAQNARVDIDNVVRAGRSQKVIGYTFAEETRRAVYFDPEFKALAGQLSKAIPNLPIVDFVDASADGNKLLIFAGSDQDPGRYYVFDRTAKALEETVVARPKLGGRTLAKQRPVSITAPDGAVIPAYLTLPPGSDGKNLSAVVLPHGGPSARDEWGFDWLSQFLATRGYAVLQPQYRGSAGFGDAWLNQNGFKNWRTSIGDITASAKWLASEGIADANRIAIVGWSYGGYAALQSAATEPKLYKAVAAIAPVTDLQMLKDEYKPYSSGQIVADFVGSGPHLTEGSPLHRAGAIDVPVLLVHGDLDTNVGIAQSEKMDGALRRAGTPSEFLRFKGLDHQLDDSAARSELLTKIGALLERTIGR